jgi:preprotein translocase subunit YajC
MPQADHSVLGGIIVVVLILAGLYFAWWRKRGKKDVAQAAKAVEDATK